MKRFSIFAGFRLLLAFSIYTLLNVVTYCASPTTSSKKITMKATAQEIRVKQQKSNKASEPKTKNYNHRIKVLESQVIHLKKELNIAIQKGVLQKEKLEKTGKEYTKLYTKFSSLQEAYEKLEAQINIYQLDIAEKTRLIASLQKKVMKSVSKKDAVYFKELHEKNMEMDKSMSRLHRIISNQKISLEQREKDISTSLKQKEMLVKEIKKLKEQALSSTETFVEFQNKFKKILPENETLKKEIHDQADKIADLNLQLIKCNASEKILLAKSEKNKKEIELIKEKSADSKVISPKKEEEVKTKREVIPKQTEKPSAYGVQLRPGLILDIFVRSQGKLEISMKSRRITQTGIVLLDYIGQRQVNGLTVDQFNEQLRYLYSEYFHFPEVDVQFVLTENDPTTYPWGHVTILGRINRPGRVYFPPSQTLTISEAVQKAGGFDTSPKITKIRVTRMHPDGKKEEIKVNLKPHKNKPFGDDIFLQPNDSIYIPETFF